MISSFVCSYETKQTSRQAVMWSITQLWDPISHQASFYIFSVQYVLEHKFKSLLFTVSNIVIKNVTVKKIWIF